MNKIILGGSLAALLAAGAAIAAPLLGAGDRTVSVAELKQRAAERFKALDANGDGNVTKAEMDAGRVKRMEKRGERGPRHAAGLFGKADADRNGIVTRTEFDTALTVRAGEGGGRHGMRSGTDRQDRSAEFFKRLDSNGDGSIDKAEADTARARFDERRGEGREHRAGDRFARLDTDHNGAVSLAEFNARDSERIGRLDANHDGQISPDEFEAARAAFRGKHERH